MCCLRCWSGFFFFNDTATTEIYTLSLTRRSSDLTLRLVITGASVSGFGVAVTSAACCFGLDRAVEVVCPLLGTRWDGDRKSTRLNSSHGYISYAVFCLNKKTFSKHSDS